MYIYYSEKQTEYVLRHCREQTDEEYIKQEIKYILERIQEDLLKGFLDIPLRDADGIFKAAIVGSLSNGNVTVRTFCEGGYRSVSGCSKYIKLCRL